MPGTVKDEEIAGGAPTGSPKTDDTDSVFVSADADFAWTQAPQRPGAPRTSHSHRVPPWQFAHKTQYSLYAATSKVSVASKKK